MGLLRTGAAGLLAFVATNVVFLAVLGLNRPLPPPPPPKVQREVNFEVEAARKPPPPDKPPPPRRTPPKAPPPPSVLLGSSLSGLSFGLDAFASLNVDGSAGLAGGAGDDVVMTAATVDDPPKPVDRTAPEYPVRARAKAIEGYVNLSVLIGEDGVVKDVQVLEAEPAGMFEEAARSAMRSWRFQPGMYQGRAVPVRVQQMMRFTLE